ncbi:uncharacterized protein BDV17DRAFT_288917 [Aspergillus undulatus]|uniref:uncharacterized protein n=1 Tax=Aspergillus undulatus TaxID=1810928 RepID=UPI003CCD2715
MSTNPSPSYAPAPPPATPPSHHTRKIPFTIYERDPHLTSRHQGWAITLHWALSYLPSLLPPDVLSGIEAVQVDSDVGQNCNGNFLFLNLQTGNVHWRIPPNKRWRVDRVKLRRALLQGIEDRIEWGVRVEGVRFDEDEDGRPRVVYRRTADNNMRVRVK